jgi:hypothetical protein
VRTEAVAVVRAVGSKTLQELPPIGIKYLTQLFNVWQNGVRHLNNEIFIVGFHVLIALVMKKLCLLVHNALCNTLQAVEAKRYLGETFIFQLQCRRIREHCNLLAVS